MSLKKHDRYRFNDFEVNLARRSLRRGGYTVVLSDRAFDLLVFFVQNAQRIVTEGELIDALWPESDGEEGDISAQISLLRKTLTGTGSDHRLGSKLIRAVPGQGYEFTARVTTVREKQDVSAKSASLNDRLVLGVVRPETGVAVEEAEEESEADGTDSEPIKENFVSLVLAALGPASHPARFALVIAVVAIIVLGGWFGWRRLRHPARDSLSLVIADFENTTGEPEFDGALKTALTIDLQQSPYLSIASQEKAGESSQPLSPESAREVCQRLNGQAYLTGSIYRFAQRYLVSVKAFDCVDDGSLGQSKGIADSPDSILIVLDKVAANLRKQLGEPGKSVARFNRPLFPDRTASLAALKAYSDAGQLATHERYRDSIPLFQQAIELDPQFTVAYAALGNAYSNLGDNDLAAGNLTKAYGLRDTVDEQNRLSIVAAYNDLVTGDLRASIRSYKQWTEEYPRNPIPLGKLADLETEIGKPALAIDPARRAMELSPANSIAYAQLARAQMHLGQFDEATSTCRLAISRHLDQAEIHAFLFQIAFRLLDQPAMDEQIAWAKGKPSEPYMTLQQGLMDFALGKVKAGQARFDGLVEIYRKQGQNERANRILEGLPRIEAELGLTESAHAFLARLPEVKGSTDIPVAWAEVGETSRAEALLKRELAAHPNATLWQEDHGPQINAAIALNQHRPEAAIQALQRAIPYDLRTFDLPALRGRAYLAAKQPSLAEAEFHKILDHSGVEPFSHNYPLAQLGLARSLAQQGKVVDASFAYKVVLQIWKDADPDLPRFREAKEEFARLNEESIKGGAISSHNASKSRHK